MSVSAAPGQGGVAAPGPGGGVDEDGAGAAVLLACREVSSVFEGITPPPPLTVLVLQTNL